LALACEFSTQARIEARI